MIRKRVASIDDTAIYRLIIQEIVPFSKKYRNISSISVSSIQKRLSRNITFVSAQGNRSPLGFISIIIKNHILFVDMLAVHTRFQGRGLGKQLLLEAEQFGLKKRCRAVRLFVDDTNTKAIGFYESRGYSTSRYVTELGCYIMDKSLLPV